MSNFVNLVSGVRQGGVLSSSLFAIYVDDIAKKIIDRGIGYHMSFIYTDIFLYVADLFLIAPSVRRLQIVVNVCETELSWLDKRINVHKSVCMRFGQRFDKQCANITTDSEDELKWVEECRYLDVYLVSARRFICSRHNAKCAFYGRLGSSASSEVVLHLVRSKCISVLFMAWMHVQSMLLISSRCSIRSLIFV